MRIYLLMLLQEDFHLDLAVTVEFS